MPTPREALSVRLLRNHKVDQETGCWISTAHVARSGYPKMGVGRRSHNAHHVAFQVFVGPIPAGHEVDHLCNNPLCINPAHLEAVTPEENKRRSQMRRTHCRRGHPFDDENTHVRGTHRVCRACDRLRSAKYRPKRKSRRKAPFHEPDQAQAA